jgi:hypothetical protein
MVGMTSWEAFTTSAPELAGLARARFEANGLALLATLRADGWPRISGIEPLFARGELWLGMMPGSRKALDLQRDPRLALHNATTDKEVRDGDVKVTGRGIEVVDEATVDRARADFEAQMGYAPPPGPMHLFRVDVTEVASIGVGDGKLVIDTWREGHGLRRVERA